MNELTRPLLRYHGGKWRMANWIISHLPQHKVYVEPFGGAASVLLRKQRSYAEVYNDLDGEVVSLFRVLRDPAQARELIRLCQLTPYARAEFELSYLTASDPIEQARRTLFRFAAGFSTASSNANGYRTGFRGNVTRSGSTPAGDWSNFPDVLEMIAKRLRAVVIENRPASDIITQYDTPDTLFYIDPPYPYSTRSERHAGAAYKYEMDDNRHGELADLLKAVAGMVVISGYACDLYDRDLYPDWQRQVRSTYADRAKKRVEVLWLNDKANARLAAVQRPLWVE